MSTSENQSSLREVLHNGELTLEGQFVTGSNYTFLGQVRLGEIVHKVVYKPVRGELPLWDFPASTLSKREVAAYVLSEGLHWNLIPLTIFRQDGPLGPGSVQLYVDHDPEQHYFTFSEPIRQRLRPAVLFDLIINNADRKGGHFLLDEQDHIWLIDHGICFHEEDKLRTVVWDFSGEEIPDELLADMQRLMAQLDSTSSPIFQELACYLARSEIQALRRRMRYLLSERRFPTPGNRRRPYPWPPV